MHNHSNAVRDAAAASSAPLARKRVDPFPAVVALAAIALAQAPYAVGAALSHGRTFLGCVDNVNDSGAYLAWMRQGMDGAWFAPSPFDPQTPPMLAVSPLYAFFGLVCRVAHVPLIAGFEAFRVLGQAVLLAAVALLIRTTVRGVVARRAAMAIACFSSGLGFLSVLWPALQGSVDLQQPEANAFYSSLTFPGFTCGEALQIVAIILMLTGERAGKMRYALFAGALGLVIGLTHPYDCVSLAAVWIVYLAARAALKLGDLPASLLRLAAAAVVAIPGLLPVAYELRTNPAFAAQTRVPANSANIGLAALGFGLPLLLAIYGAWAVLSRRSAAADGASEGAGFADGLLLACWAFANTAVSYAPIWAQRKLLQGAQFPIDILAGVGLATLVARLWPRAGTALATAACALATLATMPTNLLLVSQAIDRLHANRDQFGLGRLFLSPGDAAAFDWISRNARPGAIVQPIPWIGEAQGGDAVTDATMAFLTPAMTGHPVYAGNIWYSPQFMDRMSNIALLTSRSASESDRVRFFSFIGVQYLIAPNGKTPPGFQSIFDAPGPPSPPYRRVYGNSDDVVYQFSAQPWPGLLLPPASDGRSTGSDGRRSREPR